MPFFQLMQHEQIYGRQQKNVRNEQGCIEKNTGKSFHEQAAGQQNSLQESNIKYKAAGVQCPHISKREKEEKKCIFAVGGEAIQHHF